MVRFRCIHCGERIAVQDRHMDRLATCPECGGVTHPLAEHLVEKGRPTDVSRAAIETATTSVADAPRCANCGDTIGKLQKPLEWEGHAVCAKCHRELSLHKTEPLQPTSLAVRKSDAIETFTPTVVAPVVPVDTTSRPPSPRASDFAIAMRGAVLGLCLTAIALYAIVSILQSVGVLIVWGAAAVAVLAAAYWVRKGLLAFRKRIGLGGSEAERRQVKSIVRD